jgi:hypothetical protein
MASFRYPRGDLDQSALLLRLLGTHWSEGYHGLELLRQYLQARTQLDLQTEQDTLEACQAASRLTVPVTHTTLCLPLQLLQSQQNLTEAAFASYDGSYQYDGTLRYGCPAPQTLYSFAVPGTIRKIPAITNRLQDPSVTWIDGLDYYLDSSRGVLHLRQDPFATGLFTQEAIYTDGEQTDTQATLWGLQVGIAKNLIHEHYGWVPELYAEPTEGYRDLVNATWDNLVEGAHHQSMLAALAAVCDVPLALSDETVVDITRDAKHLLIITDQHAYKAAKVNTSSLAIGDRVQAGQSLTDALVVYELTRGETPSSLYNLTLGKGYLANGYFGGLSFPNKDVDLVVTTDDDGYTKLSCELGGWPGDVTQFWDDFHTRGKAAGQTLAQLLDQRTNQVGEPTSVNLPATINPLEFLVENVLRYHVAIVKLVPQYFGPDALPLSTLRYLRQYLPPHVGMLIQVTTAAEEDSIDPEALDPAARVAETPGLLRALPSIAETITTASVAEGSPRLYYMEGICF